MPIYRKILVATDGSALSQKAVRTAASLAKLNDAALTIFYAAPSYPPSTYVKDLFLSYGPRIRLAKEAELHARRLLQKAANSMRRIGIRPTLKFLVGPYPAAAILQFAAKLKPDLIVMGHRGHRPLPQLLLGGTTREVLARWRGAVLVVR
ncbi:MAG: universal stress protein [Burkholderiales bacterium]